MSMSFPFFIILSVMVVASFVLAALVLVLGRKPEPARSDTTPYESADRATRSSPPLELAVAQDAQTHEPEGTLLELEPPPLAHSQVLRRWDEFVEAFADRDAHARFTIKAAVQTGSACERVWLKVLAIENDTVYCQLDADGSRSKPAKTGRRFRVPVQDIEDWLFKSRGRVEGGFGIVMMNEALRREREES